MCHRRPVGRVAALMALTAGAATLAWANPAGSTGADSVAAVWMPREITFVYKAFTTKYSCDTLRTRMKSILLRLGARPDVQVRSYGCMRVATPERLPGVSIRMHVLQPADTHTPQTTPARWSTVDFVANRDPTEAAGDCELLSQITREVLPQFTTRNVQANTTCVPRTLIVGNTELKADVLVAGGSAVSRTHAPGSYLTGRGR